MPARACLARNVAADLEGLVLAMDEVVELGWTVRPVNDVVPVNPQM
jgi:hypothetical protein